ncbi:MAG: hypothetical protein WC201_05460 [Bacilli bacterium]
MAAGTIPTSQKVSPLFFTADAGSAKLKTLRLFAKNKELRETPVYNTIIGPFLSAIQNYLISTQNLHQKSKLSSYLHNLIELGSITRKSSQTMSWGVEE